MRDQILLVLAVLTSVLGTTLLLLLVQRFREERRQAKQTPPRMNELPVVVPPLSQERPAASALAPERRSDHAAICPACGSRYAYGVRTCARDHSELSALN